MDKITLFNQALFFLGDREYIRDTPTGRACDLWFPDVLHRALTKGAWTFATKYQALPRQESGGYLLPDDCLRVLRVDARRYVIEGREIRVTEESLRTCCGILRVGYISNSLAKEERLPETEPEFCHGVMLLLAAKLALKLSSSPQLAASLEQDAQRMLGQALHRNVVQAYSNDQHPLTDAINNSIL